ncbi:small multi-drug export protein [Candidatus Pacearchaeota archaeon]|nr:small multi-drug export protein [Candidatus Pacearchaeota archaeon]
MSAQIYLAYLLTILPVFELRAGLPLVIEYALKNNQQIWPYVLIVIILNILAIFLAFMFLDFLHNILMNFKFYKKLINKVLIKAQKKAAKLEKKMDKWGYVALMLLVAVPLPGTGAYTGALVSWILGLNRKNSLIAIAAGVIIAGLLVLLITLGFARVF